LLGGHQVSIAGLKQILQGKAVGASITICEIGCGGGDNLKAISDWCKSNEVETLLIGIDIKPECTAYARNRYPELGAQWITADYASVFFTEQPTIIFSTLFCHHFSEEALRPMLAWMKKNSQLGFFINDLHRHFLAYYSIKLLTGIFSKSYLVKNDAPLSVARGFKKEEWISIFAAAGIPGVSITWRWAFRYLIVYCHDERPNS
jgi:2-polyprenyl-3-methyl-5-hydroxy-6-metoxy-1,4-benzoquinol methylase